MWALVGAAMVFFAAAFVSIPGPIRTAHGLIGAGLICFGVAVVWRRADQRRRRRTGQGLSGVDGVDRRIEQLQDLRWELRESEARYRDLLDAQIDIIIRRDSSGRLTFANQAFCISFGVELAAVLGTDFEPEVVERAPVAEHAADLPPRTSRTLEYVETAVGKRWIAWERRAVPGIEAGATEVQIVGRDVTAQRRSAAELAQARDDADAANRAKSRFLAAMSHEIRTPMNGILGMAGLLSDTTLSAEQQTYVRAVDQSARTLLALIDEILDFSKIEAGKLELNEAPFALDAMVQEVVELLSPRAHDKGLEVAWTIERNMPQRLIGDAARIRQILLNLVGNAVKFTDRGGINVSIGRARGDSRAERIVFRVRDTGIGLSQEAIGSLFREFEQADDPARRRQGGSGLGLAISQRLARAMGGDVTLTSAPGRGSTFVVDIPLRAAPGTTRLLQHSAPASRHVLLAFDRLIERRAVRDILKAADVPVTEADGLDCAQLIAEAAGSGRSFDLIVVDCEDDPQAAGRLLAQARSAAPSHGVDGIVLISAVGRANLKEFREQGFDAYLVRPVRPQSLLAHVDGFPLPSTIEPTPEHVQMAPATARAGAKAPSVLLVEDNAINALLARSLLEKFGCTTAAVISGREAIEAVQATLDGAAAAFDLILMDVHLPELDGLTASRAICQMFATSSAPRPAIVALTANAFEEDRQRCLAAGMDDYLPKPFDKAALQTMLERWCGARRPLLKAS